MELALSLGGDTPADQSSRSQHEQKMIKKDLRFCMGLGNSSQNEDHINKHNNFGQKNDDEYDEKTNRSSSLSDPPLMLQLDLLPFSPSTLHQSPPPQPPPSNRPFSWLSQILTAGEPSSRINKLGKGLDVKPLTALVYDPENGSEEPATARATVNQSSPHYDSNSDTSSFQMDFSSIFRSSSTRLPLIRKSRDLEELVTTENVELYSLEVLSELRDQRVISSKRGSSGYGGTISDDEDENGLGRKKLRLTKEQSAFLEDSFKQHNTLNPKQKLVLANQLNLRPRQVEVWFQNRRARTKLKQTEVDCEYLKTCCETLTEENRRLHKELQELRALKTTYNSHPFYMQLPPTTLTMCPSCERVVTTTPPPTTTTTITQPANGFP